MKLDRNVTNPRRGKYAVLKLRQLDDPQRSPERQSLVMQAMTALEQAGILDYGDSEDTDFFLMRLKDRFTGPALRGYARAISEYLETLPKDSEERASLVEYHHEIITLAEFAHRNACKRTPD